MTEMSSQDDHFSEFFRDALATGYVYSMLDDGQIPTPTNDDGVRAMPFWSSVERVEKVIEQYEKIGILKPIRIPLAAFKREWLPGIEADKLKVGINWVGRPAAGFDIDPSEVLQHLERTG